MQPILIAILVVVADLAARSVGQYAELPLGSVTAFPASVFDGSGDSTDSCPGTVRCLPTAAVTRFSATGNFGG